MNDVDAHDADVDDGSDNPELVQAYVRPLEHEDEVNAQYKNRGCYGNPDEFFSVRQKMDTMGVAPFQQYLYCTNDRR